MSVFDIGLSGLYSAQLRLRTTAHNIANLNTPGFKRERTDMVDVSAAAHAQGGVRTAAVTNLYTQGQLDFTGNAMDLAVTGNGFFQLNDRGNTVYARNGAFHLDSQGYMVNASQMRLSGYQADASGNISQQVGEVRIPSTVSTPRATSQVAINANLDANATAPVNAFNPADATSYNFQTSTTVQDSLGVNHRMDIYFAKNATPNGWDVYTSMDGTLTPGSTAVQFDSAGALVTPAGGTSALPTVVSNNGAAPMNITMNLSGTTQYGAASTVNSIAQDGHGGGAGLSGVSIDTQGMITARYSDGQSRNVGRVAMANVPNPDGMILLDGGVFAGSAAAGDVVMGSAGAGGFGEIQGGALETSNVNLEEEAVNLLQAKMAYQANAKVISTQSKMLGSLFNAIA